MPTSVENRIPKRCYLNTDFCRTQNPHRYTQMPVSVEQTIPKSMSRASILTYVQKSDQERKKKKKKAIYPKLHTIGEYPYPRCSLG
jgi:hypothetical protein